MSSAQNHEVQATKAKPLHLLDVLFGAGGVAKSAPPTVCSLHAHLVQVEAHVQPNFGTWQQQIFRVSAHDAAEQQESRWKLKSVHQVSESFYSNDEDQMVS